MEEEDERELDSRSDGMRRDETENKNRHEPLSAAPVAFLYDHNALIPSVEDLRSGEMIR